MVSKRSTSFTARRTGRSRPSRPPHNAAAIIATSTSEFDITRPVVASLQLTPAAPVKLGPLTVVGNFSEAMDLGGSTPVAALYPAGGAPSVQVASTGFTASQWTGSIFITTSIAEGTASLVFTGGRDLAGNLLSPTTFTFLLDYSPPAAPNTVQVAIQNGAEARVSWVPSEANGKFSVYRKYSDAEGGEEKIATNLTTSFFVDTPPAISTSVYYAVSATDLGGNEGARSTFTVVSAPFTPTLTSPGNGSNFSSRLITVGGRAQRGATVQILTSTGGVIGQGVSPTNTIYSVPALVPGEGANMIRTRMTDAHGNQSAMTSTITVNVNFAPVQVATPAVTTGDTLLDLTWPQPADEDVAGYWVYRDGASAPLHVTRIPAAQREFTDSGLTNGRLYRYRVAAQDAAGQLGPKSEIAEARPVAGSGW